MSRRMRLPKAPVSGNPAIDNAYAGLRNSHRFMSDGAHFTLHLIERLNRNVPKNATAQPATAKNSPANKPQEARPAPGATGHQYAHPYEVRKPSARSIASSATSARSEANH